MSRLVFRLLDEDGSHWYLDRDGHWDRSHDDAYVFATPSEARAELKAFRKLRPEEGKAVRVCRLYTADETRRRRQARLLRDLATRYVVRKLMSHGCECHRTVFDTCIEMARNTADIFWPEEKR